MTDQTPLDKQICAALDARAEALDGHTLSRLRQARAAALEQGQRRRNRWLTAWLPATGILAAATLVALNVWTVQPQPNAAPELALLESLAAEETHAAQQDLDFFEWLARDNGAA